MKRTLLDMTQNILSALNSDEVNSISDTTESLQVAEILKTTFYNIMSRSSAPLQEELFQLDSSLDSTQPVLMYRPDHIAKMEWIKYFDTSAFTFTSNVNSFTLNYNNNKQPQFCTVIQNLYVIFDGYYKAKDSTLET